MAERLGRALQKLLQRFKSASDLTKSLYRKAIRGFLFSQRTEPQVRVSGENKNFFSLGEKEEEEFGALGGFRAPIAIGAVKLYPL